MRLHPGLLAAFLYLPIFLFQPTTGVSPHLFLQVGMGTGSGVYLGNGYVLTAAHVLNGNNEAMVVTDSGLTVRAPAVEVYTNLDVAILRPVTKLDARPARIACYEPGVGSHVKAYANPRGLRSVVSEGMVAKPSVSIGPWGSVLTADLSAAPGSSGGAVMLGSKIIGIIAGVMSRGEAIYRFSFIVPTKAFCPLLKQDGFI